MFLKSFDILANFWTMNPQCRVHSPLAKLYNEDTSKEKKISSKIMWAICMYLDPSDENQYRNYPIEDRGILIREEYLSEFDRFVFEDYIEIINWYKEIIITPAERALISWREKLEERTKLLMETPYTIENAESLDKIVGNTDKLFSQLERVEKAYEKEKLSEVDKAGAQASATDKGLM